MTRHRTRSGSIRFALWLLAAAGLVAACQEKTGALTPSEQQRIDSEGLVRRADDLIFRYTHDAGTRDAGWEDRKASIIVTKQSVIIHKNEKLGLEITAADPPIRVGATGRQPRADQRGRRGVGGELVVRTAGRSGGVGGGYSEGREAGQVANRQGGSEGAALSHYRVVPSWITWA